MSTIEAGYRVTITSWENDADNYRTVIRGGFAAPQMAFLVELLKHMESNSNGGFEQEQFGNLYDPDEFEMDSFSRFILRLAKKHGVECNPDAEYEDKYDLYGAAEQAMYDKIGTDLYDLGLSGGDFYTRVCEKYVVEYVPEPVEIEDVTHQFD